MFAELQSQLTGWFGRKRRSRDLIVQIRKELKALRTNADEQDTEIREAEQTQTTDRQNVELMVGRGQVGFKAGEDLQELSKREIERTYSLNQNKTRDLDMWFHCCPN